MQQIINRYGQALFNLALSHNLFDLITNDVAKINHLFTAQPSIRSFLISRATVYKDAQLACTTIVDQLQLNKSSGNFLRLLIKNRRLNLFEKIVRQYHNLIDLRKEIIRGHITSAKPLSDHNKQHLEEMLSEKFKKTIICDYHLDNNLLAGYIVKIQSLTLDCSLKNKFLQLQQYLLTP